MSTILRNGRGFAIVYGLIVLIAVTIAGTALLFLTRKSRTGAVDYGKMRVASQAAMAALKACEGQFLNDPDIAFGILKKYEESSGNHWMLGSADDAATEQKIALWNDDEAPEYSARIVGYDREHHYITIEGTGYVAGGGKKKVLGMYELAGLGNTNWPIGSHALFLGGRLQNCNARISIKGDVYLSMDGGSPQHFNQGGRIYGDLKTGASSNVMDFTGSGSLTVDGNAFMQCRLEPQEIFFIRGDAGFTGSFTSNFTSDIRINGNGYFTQMSNFGSNLPCIGGDKGGGKTVYYNLGSVGSNRFTDFTYSDQIPSSTSSYVAGQLGMDDGSESPFTLNMPVWGAGVVKSVPDGTYTGSQVEGWWNKKKADGTLYMGEWLVCQLTDDITMDGGTFSKKAVWITGNHAIIVNKEWYDCTDESNTLIIVNGTGFLTNMGVGNHDHFRGVIYVSSTSTNLNYQFGTDTKLYGMIHHAGSAGFNLNNGPTDSLRIWFDTPLGRSAVQEIVNTGIIVPPGYSSSDPPGTTLIDLKIRPTLMGLQL